MELDLRSKRVLVTGSSSGIGEAVATALAAQGCHVAVHGRDRDRTMAVAGRLKASACEAIAILGDLTIDEEAAKVCDQVMRAWGGLDILVNNAGGAPGTTSMPWMDVTPELWLETHSRNAVAAARLIRRFAPGMKERGWGRIIQVASAAATLPTTMGPDYGAAKAAMVNMTVSLAQELRGTGVTVNAVSPGIILTPGVEQWLSTLAQNEGRTGASAEEIFERATGRSGGLGRPEHVAHVVCMLSAEAAAFITGNNLRVDGGHVPTVN